MTTTRSRTCSCTATGATSTQRRIGLQTRNWTEPQAHDGTLARKHETEC